MIPRFFLSTACLMRLFSANRPKLILIRAPQYLVSDRGFCAYRAENLISEDLQKIADSFALFKAQIDEWFSQSG